MLDWDDLRDVDRRLVEYLAEGRVTPAYARERLDAEDVGEYSRGYVQQRLKRLEEHGHAINKTGGLYELVDDPRREDDAVDDEADLRGELQAALEARDDAQARAGRLADRVDDLEAQLADARAVDVDALRRAAEDLEAACERGDGDAVQAALDRLREAIGDE